MQKKLILVISVIIVVLVTVAIYQQSNQLPEERALTNNTLSRPDINLEFTYPFGEGGYSVAEAPAVETPVGNLLGGFILSPAQMTETPGAYEGEPVISIFVIDERKNASTSPTITTPEVEYATKKEELEALATKYTSFTGIDLLMSEVSTTSLDGVEAIHYVADGLYPRDTYLAKAFGKLYLFVGQYNDPADKIHQDFETIVKSVSFI